MAERNQKLEIDKGCHARFRLRISDSGLTSADVENSDFIVTRNGVYFATKTMAAADIVASDDGEDILLDVAFVPEDTDDWTAEAYGWQWFATIDGEFRRRGEGEFRVFE